MKRLILLALASCVSLLLSACGDNSHKKVEGQVEGPQQQQVENQVVTPDENTAVVVPDTTQEPVTVITPNTDPATPAAPGATPPAATDNTAVDATNPDTVQIDPSKSE